MEEHVISGANCIDLRNFTTKYETKTIGETWAQENK
jgi:hypothetical protein